MEAGSGYLVKDDLNYNSRLRNFAELLYHPLLQKPYPLAPEEQVFAFLQEEVGVQFIGINSCWKIDEYFPDRSAVNEVALAKALQLADRQIEAMGKPPGDSQITRLIVLHHPIAGEDQIRGATFVEQLQKAHVKVCLHGHVHETRAELIGYVCGPTSLHVVGAGSFGASARARPESTPRLYNVLELRRGGETLRVHTRSLRKNGGAWEPWAVWPGRLPNERFGYYDVRLRP